MVAVGVDPMTVKESWWKRLAIAMTVALVIVSAAGIRNLDGGIMSMQDVAVQQKPTLEFGWPFVYAIRTWNYTVPINGEGRCLLLDVGSVNGVPETVTRIEGTVLAGNIGIVALLVLGAMVGFQRSVRLVLKRPQFSVRGLIASVGFFGTVFCFYRSRSIWDTIDSAVSLILLGAIALSWYAIFCVPKNKNR